MKKPGIPKMGMGMGIPEPGIVWGHHSKHTSDGTNTVIILNGRGA